MKIAFKKGIFNQEVNIFGFKVTIPWFDGWYGFGIVVRSQSIYCHVELIFSDGLSYSADEQGTRFKKIDYSHPERWNIFDFKSEDFVNPRTGKKYTSEIEMRVLAEKIAKTENDGYDWDNIFIHEGLNLPSIKNNKWYCSEIDAYIMGFGIIIKNFALNPGELCREFKKYMGIK
jgi:hypothetical protein